MASFATGMRLPATPLRSANIAYSRSWRRSASHQVNRPCMSLKGQSFAQSFSISAM